MDVFDSATKTTTRSHGGAKDSNLPAIGSLQLGGAITAPTALSGTVGTDSKLIHGDRWQQIEGNETDFIVQNYMRTIDGNENRLLLGNLETSVMQTTKDDRFGTYLGNYYDISTFNYWHQRHEEHSDIEQEHQPTNHLEVTDGVSKKEENRFESTSWKSEAVGFFAGVTTVKVEALGTAGELFGAKAGVGGIEATGVGWREKAEALETKLDAFASWISGVKAEAGGPETAIRPVFVGILVAVHIDSPFA